MIAQRTTTIILWIAIGIVGSAWFLHGVYNAEREKSLRSAWRARATLRSEMRSFRIWQDTIRFDPPSDVDDFETALKIRLLKSIHLAYENRTKINELTPEHSKQGLVLLVRTALDLLRCGSVEEYRSLSMNLLSGDCPNYVNDSTSQFDRFLSGSLNF